MWSNNALHGWGVGWIGDRHDGIVVVGGESKFHGRVAIAICLLVLLLRNERMVHCLSWMCRFSILAGPRGIVHVGLRFSPETTHSPRQIHDQKISCATRIVVGTRRWWNYGCGRWCHAIMDNMEFASVALLVAFWAEAEWMRISTAT